MKPEVLFHGAAARCGAPWLVRETLQLHRATIVNYHDPQPGVLAAHLDVLKDRYAIVGLRDIVAWVQGKNDSLPPKALAITLDDGWAGNLRLERVFRDRGVTPTVFVCTQIVGTRRGFWWEVVPDAKGREELKRVSDEVRLERLARLGYRELAESKHPVALTWDQVRSMQTWADIQSHTCLHPILPQCDESRAWREIAGSRDELCSLVDGAPYALAYPNGCGALREREMARQAGYECALTIDARFVAQGDDPYSLPRIPVSDTASTDELLVKLSGIHHQTRRLLQAMRVLPDWT